MATTHARYTESALVSKQRYISTDWLAAEYERLWPKVWQMACRMEQIPRNGDYYEYMIGTQSILVVRENEDSIKAFRNACPHRATRIRSGTGNTDEELRCPFHGWAWKLDGTILEIPDADDFAPECLSRADLQLAEVHVGLWGGFVFINMSEDPEPLLTQLGPVADGLAKFEVDKMRFRTYRSTIMDCNWKVGHAAFNETYHALATHFLDLGGLMDGTRVPSGDVNYNEILSGTGRGYINKETGRGLGTYDHYVAKNYNFFQKARGHAAASPRLGDLGPDARTAALTLLEANRDVG
ncbi:MAG: Rieske (2Fe-2S) domain protein, partial [Actinoallomurus sp.]|nr:Rieske (2Fe-2S) domain protein [Actinoallomurus sp.]